MYSDEFLGIKVSRQSTSLSLHPNEMDNTMHSIELNEVGDRPNRFQVNRVATLRRSTADVVTEVDLDEDDTFDDEIVLRNNRRSSR